MKKHLLKIAIGIEIVLATAIAIPLLSLKRDLATHEPSYTEFRKLLETDTTLGYDQLLHLAKSFTTTLAAMGVSGQSLISSTLLMWTGTTILTAILFYKAGRYSCKESAKREPEF